MQLNQIIKIKLKLESHQQNDFLYEVTEQYRQACNFVSKYIFENHFELNVSCLNHLLYQKIRSKFGLKSQLAQSVLRTVTARYKTVRTQLKNKPYHFKNQHGYWKNITRTLDWLWQPIYFKRPQADLVRNRDYSFVDNGQLLSINTLNQRIKLKYISKGFEQYFDGTWLIGAGKLIKTGKNWFLHLAISKTVQDFDLNQVKHIIGIDRGLRFLATIYDEAGKTTFFDGQKILKKRHQFQQLRKELQKRGTKSAKRKLKALSGRENRWMNDVNHQISKTLVQKYGAQTLFVIEDLTNISFNRTNLHGQIASDNRSWSFYDLEKKLEYKAHHNQSFMIKVKAAYTSQRCIKCGDIDKTNRNHKLHVYKCKKCQYSSNDDRMGAMNIQELGQQFVNGIKNPQFKKMMVIE